MGNNVGWHGMNYVEAYSIDSAWRESMSMCVKSGYDFLVKGGSYVGQIRKQLPYVTIIINNPSHRPLAPILPPGIPAPTSDDKISEYFSRYIFGSEKAENEAYTYGEFIQKQLPRILSLLIMSKGNTNQATICIGNEETTNLDDPPCLRSISFKVVNGELNICVYFRSWDLYAGMPENLGGLQLLKELVLSLLEPHFPVEDGKIIAFSDGLHLYEQYFSIVDCLNVDKISIMGPAMADKTLFLQENGE